MFAVHLLSNSLPGPPHEPVPTPKLLYYVWLGDLGFPRSRKLVLQLCDRLLMFLRPAGYQISDPEPVILLAHLRIRSAFEFQVSVLLSTQRRMGRQGGQV